MTKCEDHQIHIFDIDARVTSTNQTRICDPYIDCSTSKEVSKLQKKSLEMKFFVFTIMAKSILLTRNWGLLRRKTVHGDWHNDSAWRSNSLFRLKSHFTGENL